jgi:hypothetical protein
VRDIAGEPVGARRERHLLPELDTDRRAVRAGNLPYRLSKLRFSIIT